jgi:hypothetical protein
MDMAEKPTKTEPWKHPYAPPPLPDARLDGYGPPLGGAPLIGATCSSLRDKPVKNVDALEVEVVANTNMCVGAMAVTKFFPIIVLNMSTLTNCAW